jgi:hypothetical protein
MADGGLLFPELCRIKAAGTRRHDTGKFVGAGIESFQPSTDRGQCSARYPKDVWHPRRATPVAPSSRSRGLRAERGSPLFRPRVTQRDGAVEDGVRAGPVIDRIGDEVADALELAGKPGLAGREGGFDLGADDLE